MYVQAHSTHECFGGKSKSWGGFLPPGHQLLMETGGRENDREEPGETVGQSVLKS